MNTGNFSDRVSGFLHLALAGQFGVMATMGIIMGVIRYWH